MLNRLVRNLAVTTMTIVSATALTALGAAGASAAATTAVQPGHADVATNTVRVAPAAHRAALAGAPTTLAAPVPASGKALASPFVSDSPDAGTCYHLTVVVPPTAGTYFWNDPGLHQDIRTTANTTCYTPVPLSNGAYNLRINGGTDCAKVIYPDPDENQIATDQGCDNTSLEQFNLDYVGTQDNTWNGYLICLHAIPTECLAVNGIGNNEIVGGLQSGPNVWWFET
jgi:hypothetical protein